MADAPDPYKPTGRRRFERRELTPEAEEIEARRLEHALDPLSLREAVRAAEHDRRGGPRPEVLEAIDRHLERDER